MPASALPADALVAFGTTGDLARQTTFSALYRLAQEHVVVGAMTAVAYRPPSFELPGARR
jgi:glucose-6-phosphate 1-dehydrogenase